MGIIGSTIKPFKATAFQAGKDFFDVSDSDVKGDWAVFFFYPADFTFVCPTELEDLAEQYDSLKGMGVEVYGVSTDTHFSHKAWHDTSEKIGKIKFRCLATSCTRCRTISAFCVRKWASPTARPSSSIPMA